jgi:hypothetical protein
MKIKFKLLESNKDIESKILTALLSDVTDMIKNSGNKISATIKNIVINAIQSSPEYQSLISGSLKAEFGIPDPERRLSELLNLWTKKVSVIYKPPKISNSRITTSFKLELIRADLSDVLGSDIAIVTDSLSGKSVHWLEWLSLAGDKTIIKDYTVVYGRNRRSRTGLAIMRESVGSRWRVPAEFAGTINNNWITRSIDAVSDEIEQAIEKGFKI